jgi:hypothetical protein
MKWSLVKAIAGCPTDDIPGVDGVAEKLAIKYLKKEMNEKTATFKKIVDDWPNILYREERLTRLPYPTTPPFEYKPDEGSAGDWDAVMKSFGATSLVGKFPGAGYGETRR